MLPHLKIVKQAKNRTEFEEDILKGKLNGEDLGDINHSRFFAKDLDQAIFETMKADIREKVERELDAIDRKRTFSLIFDKMTHNKTTGQITGAVIPVPENSLSQNFHFTVMLALPTVQDHSAEGLALNVKEVFNNYG